VTDASSNMAISARGLSKRFRSYASNRQRLASWLTGGRWGDGRWIDALAEVSFEVRRGEALAVVGANGAGKSTLLKIVARTLRPSAGSVSCAGRIGALLELGMGFHPDFTGRENIRLNGLLLNFSRVEITRAEGRIIEFSELGPFIDQPIRTYSTGMIMRLGYSVAAAVSPDVLVIDEVLAVGDAYFQQKCFDHLRRYLAEGGTVLFVSHDAQAVLRICRRAILLERGHLVREGEPHAVLEEYGARLAAGGSSLAGDGRPALRVAVRGGAVHSGQFRAVIEEASLRLPDGSTPTVFVSGSEAELCLRGMVIYPVEHLTIGMLIRDRFGNDVFGTNSHLMGQRIDLQPGRSFHARFRLRLDLGPGPYSITAALHAGDQHLAGSYDWIDRLASFEIVQPADTRFSGLVRLPVELSVSDAGPTEPGRVTEMWRRLLAAAPSRLVAGGGGAEFVLAGATPVTTPQEESCWRLGEEAMVALSLAGPVVQLCCRLDHDAVPCEVELWAGCELLGRRTLSESAPKWAELAFDVPAGLVGLPAALRLVTRGVDDLADGEGIAGILCRGFICQA